jgi:hypothetical protein
MCLENRLGFVNVHGHTAPSEKASDRIAVGSRYLNVIERSAERRDCESSNNDADDENADCGRISAPA